MPAISAFLGRDSERAWLAERIASHRLVTVVGPGGIGKTRLVAELCAAGTGFAGGAHRCELAAIGARDEISPEVAGQLGFASLDSLVLGLGDEPALLVLDNCEHVLAAAARLCRRLLEAAPALHVLATSREPLAVDGEELLVLGPLALPATADPAELEAAPATRLFEDRARAAGARREASPEERAAVAELCRRLDGVPLAIELAAARARSLTAVELLAHLDRRFDLLQRASPVGQARHRSLRAAIDASYELLDPVEQGFFRALGVFDGPFDADLAHAVAAPAGFDRLATIDVLARLVDRSLVTAEPRRGQTRYGLLDSLRHYAAEQARAAGEWSASVGRFVEAMLAHADQIVAAGLKRWSADALEQVFAQFGNLVAACERCCERDVDATRAFRLLLPLWGAVHQGRASEVAEACERVLARWPAGDEPLRAEALAVAASASLPAGRAARAVELAERALRTPSPLGLAPVLAWRAYGIDARHRGDVEAAADRFRRGAEAALAAGLAPFARELSVCRAMAEGAGGDDAGALAAIEALIAEASAADDPVGVVWAALGRTHLLLRAGRLREARASFAAAQRAREGFSYPYGAMVMARHEAALIGLERGWPASCAAWRAAIDGAASAGELAELALTLRAAGALARRAGDEASSSLLLAAVPPGVHASVSGDLFADPLDALPPASGALRRARERLDAVTKGARDETPAPERASGGALLREGDTWTVCFGGRSARVRHLKGLEDLAALLARPGEELHCLQLIGGAALAGDAGPVLDDAARRAYQARIRELQADADEARAANDPVRAERAEAELDALVQQLAEAFGLGGRTRKAGASAERARSTVSWRLRAAIKRIGEAHPELGRHLANAVRTGAFCSYRPETTVAWELRTEPDQGRSS
jgi:predicted ATPase